MLKSEKKNEKRGGYGSLLSSFLEDPRALEFLISGLLHLAPRYLRSGPTSQKHEGDDALKCVCVCVDLGSSDLGGMMKTAVKTIVCLGPP